MRVCGVYVAQRWRKTNTRGFRLRAPREACGPQARCSQNQNQSHAPTPPTTTSSPRTGLNRHSAPLLAGPYAHKGTACGKTPGCGTGLSAAYEGPKTSEGIRRTINEATEGSETAAQGPGGGQAKPRCP